MVVVDERARHELYVRLEEILGDDEATTLMAHLPPTGWSDVVTNASLDLRLDQRFADIDQRFTDIDQRFADIDHRFALVDQRFDAVDLKLEAVEQRVNARMDDKFAQQTRFFITSLLAANTTLTALVFAIARFV